MTDTPAFLAGRLSSEGEKTLKFLRGLTPADWEIPVYSEGTTWQVRDLAAHFVAAETGMRRLVENILSGGPGTPDDFDLDAYNQRKVSALKAASPDELISQYQQGREASIALVGRLSLDDLQRHGRHPWLGVVPVVEIVKMLYLHNQIHVRDIRKVLV